MRKFFWNRIHISDESASMRWALSLFLVIALFPAFGSLVDIVLIGMAVFSLNYWFFANVKFNTLERRVAIIVAIYLVISVFSPLFHENTMEGMLFGLSNAGLVMLIFLMPVLRHCDLIKHKDLLALAFPVAGIVMILGLLVEAAILPVISRAELFAGNALILAFLAGSTLMGCVVYGFQERKRRLILFLVGFASSLVVLLATGSRAPILIGMVLAFGYVAFAGLSSRNPKVIYFFLLLSFGLLAAGFAFKDFPAARYLANRSIQLIDTLTSDSASIPRDESTRMRLSYYRVGLEIVRENPLLGVGRHNVMTIAEQKAPETEKKWFNKTHLHAGYLTELAGNGILGLLSLLSVLAIPLLVSWKKNKADFHFAVLFSVFFGLYNLTNISFYHDLTVMPFVAYVLFLHARAARVEQE